MPTRPATASALAWVLVVIWLGASLGAFWFLARRDLAPFPTASAVVFEPRDRVAIEAWFQRVSAAAPPVAGPIRATLVHLYNPGCRCNAYTKSHLERLMQDYRERGVRMFAALNPARAPGLASTAALDLPVPLAVVTIRGPALAGVASAPAAFIFDAGGRLVYFGPYSDSVWCGRGAGLVEPILDRLVSRLPALASPPVGRGCFCHW